MKLARFVRRALLCSAILVTLVVIAFLIENWRGNRAWDRYEQEGLAKGQLLRKFPEPSAIPTSQNFMRTPHLEKYLFSDAKNEDYKAFVATLPMGGNGYSDWPQARTFDFASFAKAQKLDASASLKVEPTAANVRVFLQPLEPTLAELRAALSDRHDSQLTRPVTLNEGLPFDAPIARFQVVRGICFALTAEACAALSSEQPDLACTDTLALLRFCRGISGMPDILLVEAMIGTVSPGLALQPVWEATRKQRWTDAQLAAVQVELRQLHLLKALQRSLEHERLGQVRSLDILSADLRLLVPYDFKNSWNWRRLVIFPRGWVKQNQLRASVFSQQAIDLIDAVGTPDFLGRLASRDQAETEQVDTPTPNPYKMIMQGIVPSYRKMFAAAIKRAAQLTLADTACALERHRLAHGSYPATLNELVPAFLPAVPADVINGQPLRYSPVSGDSYKLYSIGLNGRDDQGALEPLGYKGDQPLGDWAWPELPR